MTITQFMGCFTSPQLMISTLLPLFLLIDPSGSAQDEKSQGYHQNHRDPVRWIPTDNGRFSHG